MLVIIKSAPGTEEAKAGLSLAKVMSSTLVLLQNGVYLARQGELDSFTGKAYILEDDVRLRGTGAQSEGARAISYDGFVDLMAEDKVVGMF